MKEQSYRASIWAIIIDKNFNFLMVKLKWELRDRFDFVKWWMNKWENEKDTLKREIKEELWEDFIFEIIKKSSWYFMYNWPLELQNKRWFRWQVRQNYWVLYKKWNIILDFQELSEYKWVESKNIEKELKKWGFPEFEIKRFLEDFRNLSKILK